MQHRKDGNIIDAHQIVVTLNLGVAVIAPTCEQVK